MKSPSLLILASTIAVTAMVVVGTARYHDLPPPPQ